MERRYSVVALTEGKEFIKRIVQATSEERAYIMALSIWKREGVAVNPEMVQVSHIG